MTNLEYILLSFITLLFTLLLMTSLRVYVLNAMLEDMVVKLQQADAGPVAHHKLDAALARLPSMRVIFYLLIFMLGVLIGAGVKAAVEGTMSIPAVAAGSVLALLQIVSYIRLLTKKRLTS